MGLPAWSLKNGAVLWFAVALLVVGGAVAFQSLGRLEDPDFTIKTAIIITPYPGATPTQVEMEVTEKIELALQEMREIDFLESTSSAGLSQIKVHIYPNYSTQELPQIWDQLRRQIRDIEISLPPGTGRPQVIDDFGDVFGLLLAIQSDGFTYAELEQYAERLQRELRLVEGVARVDLWGIRERAIYLDVDPGRLADLGISDQSIANTLEAENAVINSGSIAIQDRRFPVTPSGTFAEPADIGRVFLNPSALDRIQAEARYGTEPGGDELLQLEDLAVITEAYIEPPSTLMRFNGQMAVALSIANQPGVNVVEMGRAVDARLAELIPELPIGIEVSHVHWQSDIIDLAISSFLINLAEAIAIVLVVLTLVMGWRLGVIIGTSLILTILGTFVVMALFGIDLHRMSLGALVIALGMMVDNSIVVADGHVVRVDAGNDPRTAAARAASGPAIPLLGATVIAVMAFYPIAASPENAGEYCAALFSVVAISLVISWLLSMTVTPLQCIMMLKTASRKGQGEGRPLAAFRRLVTLAIRFRWATVAVAIGLLGSAVVAFGSVSQLFFPASSMDKFMIDYWAPEGSRLEDVAGDLQALEQHLLDDDRVVGVAAFIGAGPPRFYLPVEPESRSSAYAQLIVNVADYREIPALMDELAPWIEDAYPQALVPLRQFGVGPSNTWKFEVRVSGPADADPAALRRFSTELSAVLDAHPLVAAHQTDWRQRVPRLVATYNDARARWTGITRDDVGGAIRQAFDGREIGSFRDGDDILPIILRHAENTRQNVGGLPVIPVRGAQSLDSVPLAQVIGGLDWTWEDPLVQRRDRRRTITIQANPILGVTLPELRSDLLADIDAFAETLPVGYSTEWGGEFEASQDAQASLIPGVLPAAAIILFIMVALFNAYRPPLVIVMTIPFVIIGIAWGLLATGAPFGFVALLGAMSLAGMMIKNAIVLLDEVNANLKLGKDRHTAVVDAAVSRLRPVALAAATTVLGVIPLLQDVFWVGMAVTIMAGLSFGTVLTMILVPVLYAILYRVQPAPLDDRTDAAGRPVGPPVQAVA